MLAPTLFFAPSTYIFKVTEWSIWGGSLWTSRPSMIFLVVPLHPEGVLCEPQDPQWYSWSYLYTLRGFFENLKTLRCWLNRSKCFCRASPLPVCRRGVTLLWTHNLGRELRNKISQDLTLNCCFWKKNYIKLSELDSPFRQSSRQVNFY